MELNDVELRRLADNLSTEWKKLATFLGFTNAKIQQFELNHADGDPIENTIFEMLVAWRERQSVKSNFRKIMKTALDKCNRVDLADSILSESPMAKLDEIYTLLKTKLEMNPEKFQEAITACHEGMFSCKTDMQLSLALADMGKYAKGGTGNPHYLQSLQTKRQPVTVKSWRLVKKINKLSTHYYSDLSIHLHSGDIAAIDRKDRESPTVLVFSSDGSSKFHLSSTKEEIADDNKLYYPEGIASSRDGHYLITDQSSQVKVYDVKGQFITGFRTKTDVDRMRDTTSRLCGITTSNNGDILVGDSKPNRVTIHCATDYNLTEEIYVSIKPVFIAVNDRKQMFISDPNAEKVIACDYTGDHVFTMTPKLWGEDAQPAGVLWSESDDTILLVVFEKQPESLQKLKQQGYMVAHKVQNGHVHQYSNTGAFIKCVVKGLLRPWGMAMNNNVLAIATSETINVYNAEFN